MKISKITLLASLALTGACGQPQAGQDASGLKIVGGERVAASDPLVKSTVALVDPDGDHFCTGTLITSKLVVTAAHCVKGYRDTLYVAFGTVAQPGHFARERLRVASKIVAHEGYSEAQMDAEEATLPPNDIALLTLNEKAPEGYQPVPIMTARNEVTVGETLLLAGFGVTRWWAQTSGILYKVETNLTKASAATKEIHFGGRPGRSACMGDSGGPAFVKRGGQLALLGVTSRGSGVCDEEGIYTDVRHFYDWLVAAASR